MDTARDFSITTGPDGVWAVFHPTREGAIGLRVPVALRSGVAACGPILGNNPLELAGIGLPPGPPRQSAPVVINLGRTGCGETPAPVVFELVNSATTAASFTITPSDGSGYVVSPSTGNVPPRGRRTIMLTAPAVRQDYVVTDPVELTADRGVFGVDLTQSLDIVFGDLRQTTVVKHSGWGYAYMPDVRLNLGGGHNRASIGLTTTRYFYDSGLFGRVSEPSYVITALDPNPMCSMFSSYERTITEMLIASVNAECGSSQLLTYHVAEHLPGAIPHCSASSAPLTVMTVF
jgi:hypothetical protein